jgi:quinone-modifying oxidoreductase subunit QmoB
MESKKPGIFICEGCRIADTLDVDALAAKMQDELHPQFCVSHKALCSASGIEMMLKALDAEPVGGCVIAGCGKGTRDDAFDLGNTRAIERVNLREWVAWSMEEGEDRQMAAEDYIRMGFAGLKHAAEVNPFLLDQTSTSVLVMGGGVAGMQAALDGARNGYTVHLVEKSGQLGGWAAKWNRQIPFDQPFDQLRTPEAFRLVREVEATPGIHVYLETTIEKTGGQPGEFMITLKGKHQKQIAVGAIVTASGWKPYLPEGATLFGYGAVPGVITSVEMEAALAEGSLAEKESFLFIQCAGSRDTAHLPYCSSVCCGISLKQARQLRDLFPESIVYIVYRDIRTPGFLEDFYKAVQDDPGIIFIKGDVQDVVSSSGRVDIGMQDHLLGEQLHVTVDQVILATGMVPNDTKDLHLAYRLGEGIPELKYDFSDSHFICFPYESRRTGIYAAGGVRAPMDIPSAMADGSGAMMKAIQMIESVKRGDAVHPRAGDQSYPMLYLERCTDCKRCTEECPFGTYDETPSGTPVVNPNRCRRCGICLGACPERVISFADFSITLLSEKIKSIEVPDEFEEKPRVLVFVCENDALPALEMAARKGLKINPFIRLVPVRCLGSINRVWVSDALSKGYDGILQIGCKPGDDYQCHFIHGSELTGQRSEIYEQTLSSMMLEPERIATEFVEITDYKKIIEIIDGYMEEVDLMGPNPFKDM